MDWTCLAPGKIDKRAPQRQFLSSVNGTAGEARQAYGCLENKQIPSIAGVKSEELAEEHLPLLS